MLPVAAELRDEDIGRGGAWPAAAAAAVVAAAPELCDEDLIEFREVGMPVDDEDGPPLEG